MPLDHFNSAYCVRCINQECARSAGNNHLFVKRTTTWKEALFTNVTRAADDDPRYAEERSKFFRPVTNFAGSVDTPHPAFIDKPMPKIEIPTVTAVAEAPEVIQPAAPTTPAIPITPPKIGVHNTPFEQGTILPGGTKENVIEPGGTVVFDDE